MDQWHLTIINEYKGEHERRLTIVIGILEANGPLKFLQISVKDMLSSFDDIIYISELFKTDSTVNVGSTPIGSNDIVNIWFVSSSIILYPATFLYKVFISTCNTTTLNCSELFGHLKTETMRTTYFIS